MTGAPPSEGTSTIRTDPVHFNYDSDREVVAGDWIIERNAQTECGERWFIVIAARLVKRRVVTPYAHRWALVCQERQTPTSVEPYIPEDFPDRPGMVHFFERYRRPSKARWRQV